MINIEKKISGFLPEELKTIIRPVYSNSRRIGRKMIKIFKRPDRPSTIGIGSFEGFEIAYRKGTADEGLIRHEFSNEFHFSKVPGYQAADDHVIIDVGAHIGTFSLIASSKVPRGKVYAIEASEDSFNLLRINVGLNKASNICVHHLALADRKGTCKLYHTRGNMGHSIVSCHSRYYEDVECCTLADYLEANEIDKCNFMKLNCEGAEFPILLGTPCPILQRFDTILVLYHCDLRSGNKREDLISHLQSSGFNAVVLQGSERRGWLLAVNNTYRYENTAPLQ